MKLNKNNYRYDFPIIANWVNSNSKVLDLGCGDGELLNYLKKEKSITGYGIEKDPDNWLKSLKTGINVLQVGLEAGLSEFEDNSFDVVILSKTIQSMHPGQPNIDKKLFQDVTDNLELEQSMRQFYSTANTTIPNDQTSFAEFCYGDMISAKEGNAFASVRNNPRHNLY
jgi:phospholipid N-methyltransferase